MTISYLCTTFRVFGVSEYEVLGGEEEEEEEEENHGGQDQQQKVHSDKRAAISAKRSNCYYGQTGGRTKKFASVKLLNPGWIFTFKSSN